LGFQGKFINIIWWILKLKCILCRGK
jgi:hypothetical protein